MNKNSIRKIILLTITLIFLSACSNLETPVGIGSGRDKLKKSRCACTDVIKINEQYLDG